MNTEAFKSNVETVNTNVFHIMEKLRTFKDVVPSLSEMDDVFEYVSIKTCKVYSKLYGIKSLLDLLNSSYKIKDTQFKGVCNLFISDNICIGFCDLLNNIKSKCERDSNTHSVNRFLHLHDLIFNKCTDNDTLRILSEMDEILPEKIMGLINDHDLEDKCPELVPINQNNKDTVVVLYDVINTDRLDNKIHRRVTRQITTDEFGKSCFIYTYTKEVDSEDYGPSNTKYEYKSYEKLSDANLYKILYTQSHYTILLNYI